MSDIKAEKEGLLELYTKEKFKEKYALVSGGSLLLCKKKGETEFDYAITLKGSEVTEGGGEEEGEKDKKKKKDRVAFTVESEGSEFVFQCASADLKSWMEAIKAGKGKDAIKVTLAKKKQSAMMAMKKNISGKAATSGAGKGLIKEQLGSGGVRCLEILKEIVTLHEGKKKATEIEDNLIRFAVKILLLHKNKDISTQELMKTLPFLRAVWSNVIDACEMSFAYEPVTIAKNMKELSDCFEKLIQQHVTDKTIEMMQEMLAYITNEKLMDRLFKDDSGNEYKKELENIVRKGWIKLFKDAKK